MPYLLTGAFIVGMLASSFMFARSATKKAQSYLADLEAGKGLMEDAEAERKGLKQQVADLDYKLKEIEKDLAFEKSKNQ